jgi:nitrite reductase (NADH) large subunit
MSNIVIIGASIAGHTAAVSLRESNKDCAITLITEESFPLYDRRRILDLLSGSIKEKDIFLNDENFYRQNNINFMKEAKASSINTNKKIVYLKDKGTVSYDFLVISTGAKFISQDLPGSKKEGVFTLNALSDFKDFNKRLNNESACVTGSSALAINIARGISAGNKEVKIISSNGLADSIEGSPIEFINSQIAEIIGESEVQAVKLKEGKIIGIHSVIFADEFKSNIDFLKNSEIEINDGLISVDESMRTNLPNIFACGSVCGRMGHEKKLKSWDDAAREGLALAQNLKGLLLSS